MKASKFSDAQKAFILKQGDDGIARAKVARRGHHPLRGTISILRHSST